MCKISFRSKLNFLIYISNNVFNNSDLEWKIVYVGCAESEDYDQILDSVLVGPIPAGRHKFVFQVCEFDLCNTQVIFCRSLILSIRLK